MLTKKLVSVALTLALLLTMGMVTIAGAEGFQPTTIRFGTTSAEGTLVVNTMKAFSEKVAAATDNKVDIQIFPASQLGSVEDMAQAAQLGALDFCMSQPATLAGMGVKEMSALVLPYIFKSYEQRWNVLYGEVGREIFDKVEAAGTGLIAFSVFADGPRHFFTVEGKPIRKLEDAKGMKLRVPSTEMDGDMVVAIGASPTPTATSEMYSALQTGIVDGAEQPVAAYYNNKYFEVSKYLTLDGHTYNTVVMVCSKISWDRFSPELQAVLTEKWAEAMNEAKAEIIRMETEYLDKIRAEGVEVIELNDREKWVEAMNVVYEKHAKGIEDTVEKIKAVE